MMRIAVDIQGLQTVGSRQRGVGKYTFHLLQKLLELDLKNEYIFITNANLDSPEINDLSPHHIIRISYPNRDRRVSELVQKIALFAGCFDIFHITGNPLEVFDLVIPQFYSSAPFKVVWTLYDIIPHLFPDQYLQNATVKEIYYHRLQSLVSVDHIFAISESTRQDAIKHLGVLPEKITNISAGVNPAFSNSLSFDQRRLWRHQFQLKFKISKKFVLYLGGGDMRKNIGGLIQAFAGLPESLLRDYQLVIAGKLHTDEKRHYFKIGQKHGVQKCLLFTDFVLDEELIALYSLCALFVFPSEYEGFGLPLAEAMACGAPVITTNSSSFPEVVGDAGILVEPGSVEQLSQQMGRVLMDDQLHSEMSRQSLEQARRFSWENVATKVLNVYNQLGPSHLPSFNFKRSCKSSEDKPRIALFSPLNPARSGISDYIEDLIPYLLEHFQIDLYIDSDYQPSSEFITKQCHWFDHHAFEERIEEEHYLAVLYQLGNSSYHAYMIKYILKYAGIVTLHDYALGGLINWLSCELPFNSPDRLDFFEELKYGYGEARATEIFERMQRGELHPHELFNEGIFLNERFFDRSIGLILHSRWAYEMATAKRDVPNYADECLKHIPQGVPILPQPPAEEIRAIRQRLGIPEDALVIAAFGIIASPKRVIESIKAFAKLARENSKAILLFVGELQPGYIEPIQLIQNLNLGEKVRVTGRVDFKSFYEYIKACDLVLSLRYPTQGEASGGLLRALSLGKPAIVSNGGAFTDFPDDVVLKVIYGPDDEDDIAEKLTLLAQNVELRLRMGENARSYILEHHSLPKVAKQYVEFIFKCGQTQSARTKLLADFASEKLAHLGVSPHDEHTLDSVARAISVM